jgi:hypothetical protein
MQHSIARQKEERGRFWLPSKVSALLRFTTFFLATYGILIPQHSRSQRVNFAFPGVGWLKHYWEEHNLETGLDSVAGAFVVASVKIQLLG